MEIHVVQPGDTLYSLAAGYGVPLSQIASDNGLWPSEAQPEGPAVLVPGQALVIRFPAVTHTVRSGDTLSLVTREYGVSLRQLYQNNLTLARRNTIWPGETLVISYDQEPGPPISVNGYAYPFISDTLLRTALPSLTYVTPFTYGFTPTGKLVELSDERIIDAAEAFGTASLMHLSTLTAEGGFSNDLASLLLNDPALQDRLIENILDNLREKRYQGLDVDFEYVFAKDAAAYAAFLGKAARRLNPLGFPVIAALSPKTSADQPGLLYEGHDFAAIGAAVNQVLVMTYEWGYTYGPPMAVAPLPNVRQVLDYAVSEIPAEKIYMGVPNYGYDWPLPFERGKTKATSISSQQALALARRYRSDIQYDTRAQSPWFRYTDERDVIHEVWFEDARSIQAKLALIPEYGLIGAGYWNLMRDFPQNWVVLSSLYTVRTA